MKILKKFVTSAVVLCLVQLTPPLYAANTNVWQNQAVNGSTINQNIIFVDVQDHWAGEAIQDMANKGLISGYEDSTFQPEKSITREEFAKLIAVTFSIDLDTPKAPTYSDVQADAWSYSYIEATKQFLTGYYPPKGKAFFSPGTKATREDVAVALVKVMGYTTNDLSNKNLLQSRFKDVGSISVGLRDYVAIATEKQLISGYEDRTFRPENPITRAEVATLLYRAIKSSAHDQETGPALNVSVPATTSSGTFYVSGKTESNASVTINGKQVQTYNGEFKEGFKIDKEGSYDVEVVSKLPSGRTSSVKKTVTFTIGGPDLTIDDTPENVTLETITISGKAVGATANDSVVVYINDEKVSVDWGGSFSKKVTLSEGENSFTIKAKNNAGKTAEVSKKVTFNVGGPNLKINTAPDTTSLNTITLSGTVTDKNDSNPTVYLNENKLSVDWDGSFSKQVSLQEGKNTFTFKATNKNAKSTTATQTVVFNVDGPNLTIDTVPDSTSLKTVTISGRVKDKNDSSPVVYLNDSKLNVDWDGSFSKQVTLAEGDNVFTIKATNSNGKSSVETRTINFNVGGPELKVYDNPAETTSKTVVISGKVTDKNDSNPVLYINDNRVSVDWDGSFSKQFTLSGGENTFIIRATNSNQKVSQTTRTITFNVDAPVIKLSYYPESTSLSTFTLAGTVTDKNDSNPTLYLNDSKLNVNWDGSFSKSVSLTKGANTFKFVSSNTFGKTSTVTATVYRNDN